MTWWCSTGIGAMKPARAARPSKIRGRSRTVQEVYPHERQHPGSVYATVEQRMLELCIPRQGRRQSQGETYAFYKEFFSSTCLHCGLQLVGKAYNCLPFAHHVNSMIMATDTTGLNVYLNLLEWPSSLVPVCTRRQSELSPHLLRD